MRVEVDLDQQRLRVLEVTHQRIQLRQLRRLEPLLGPDRNDAAVVDGRPAVVASRVVGDAVLRVRVARHLFRPGIERRPDRELGLPPEHVRAAGDGRELLLDHVRFAGDDPLELRFGQGSHRLLVLPRRRVVGRQVDGHDQQLHDQKRRERGPEVRAPDPLE